MSETRCWYVVRKTGKPEHLDTHQVEGCEVERIVKADIEDHPRTVGRGSVLFLKDGGIAYSHHTTVEVAGDFGWR